MNRTHRFVGLVAAMVLSLAMFVGPRAASAHELCFDETGFCMNHPFSDYWEDNGGLPVFGYPISMVADEINGDTGETYPTQWLERNRFESHAENAGTPYEVLLGLLGKEALAQQGRDWAAEPREDGAKDGCIWFEQTGHNVCNMEGDLGFKSYWETHGLKDPKLDAFGRSLQLFGLPLTSPMTETNSSGDTVMTQWFERARFEWHPDEPAEFKVLLGLLGKEVREGATPPAPQPTPEPTPVPNPTPEPPVNDACAGIPAPVSAELEPNCVEAGEIVIAGFYGFQPNEQVGFWLTDPSGSVFGTQGTASIGPEGITVLPIPTDEFDTGLWQFTMQGVSSGHSAVVYFKIKPADTTPKSCEGTPASQNGSITPSCVNGRTTITLKASGFTANEGIGFYVTGPNDVVEDLGDVFDGPISANGQGNFAASLTISGQSLDGGVYAFTFEGKTSGHKSILYFEIAD